MNASHPLPGEPVRRLRHALETRLRALEAPCAKRFIAALACLAVSYALAWVELPLALAIAPQSSLSATHPLAAAVTARVLLGALYLCVALRQAWARWTAVVLCLMSVGFVAPLLPDEWHAFPLAAIVTATGLACKLAAAVLLILPLRTRREPPHQ